MKDLRFTSVDGSIDTTLRVDLIDNSSDNLTVFEVKHSAKLSAENLATNQKIFSQFKALPYTKGYMNEFAQANNYRLTIADSDGTDSEVVYDPDASESASA